MNIFYWICKLYFGIMYSPLGMGSTRWSQIHQDPLNKIMVNKPKVAGVFRVQIVKTPMLRIPRTRYHVPHCTTSRSNSTKSIALQITRERFRMLLRETAQPVAVITSFMPDLNLPLSPSLPKYHGATLSSFTSIAMDPHPLISFSLRIPSRMGTTLRSASRNSKSHLVINILSASQESTAVQFSRPDLYPEPFESTPHILNEEGLPVLEGSLGALSCKLVGGSWPLHELGALDEAGMEDALSKGPDAFVSELFLARVVRVESLPQSGELDDTRTLPLLYHRQKYTTTTSNPHHIT